MMAGPFYAGGDKSSHYNPVMPRVPGAHLMCGPVYEGVDPAHHCNVVLGRTEGNPMTSGPVYPVNAIHKYSGEGSDPNVHMETGMIGPVYNVLHEHHYREVSDNVIW